MYSMDPVLRLKRLCASARFRLAGAAIASADRSRKAASEFCYAYRVWPEGLLFLKTTFEYVLNPISY